MFSVDNDTGRYTPAAREIYFNQLSPQSSSLTSNIQFRLQSNEVQQIVPLQTYFAVKVKIGGDGVFGSDSGLPADSLIPGGVLDNGNAVPASADAHDSTSTMTASNQYFAPTGHDTGTDNEGVELRHPLNAISRGSNFLPQHINDYFLHNYFSRVNVTMNGVRVASLDQPTAYIPAYCDAICNRTGLDSSEDVFNKAPICMQTGTEAKDEITLMYRPHMSFFQLPYAINAGDMTVQFVPKPSSDFAAMTFTQPNLRKAHHTSGPGITKLDCELCLSEQDVNGGVNTPTIPGTDTGGDGGVPNGIDPDYLGTHRADLNNFNHVKVPIGTSFTSTTSTDSTPLSGTVIIPAVADGTAATSVNVVFGQKSASAAGDLDAVTASQGKGQMSGLRPIRYTAFDTNLDSAVTSTDHIGKLYRHHEELGNTGADITQTTGGASESSLYFTKANGALGKLSFTITGFDMFVAYATPQVPIPIPPLMKHSLAVPNIQFIPLNNNPSGNFTLTIPSSTYYLQAYVFDNSSAFRRARGPLRFDQSGLSELNMRIAGGVYPSLPYVNLEKLNSTDAARAYTDSISSRMRLDQGLSYPKTFHEWMLKPIIAHQIYRAQNNVDQTLQIQLKRTLGNTGSRLLASQANHQLCIVAHSHEVLGLTYEDNQLVRVDTQAVL